MKVTNEDIDFLLSMMNYESSRLDEQNRFKEICYEIKYYLNKKENKDGKTTT